MLSTLFMIQLISNNGVNRKIITQACKLIFTCFSRVIKILVLLVICLNCDIQSKGQSGIQSKGQSFWVVRPIYSFRTPGILSKGQSFWLYKLFIHSGHLECYQKANPFGCITYLFIQDKSHVLPSASAFSTALAMLIRQV